MVPLIPNAGKVLFSDQLATWLNSAQARALGRAVKKNGPGQPGPGHAAHKTAAPSDAQRHIGRTPVTSAGDTRCNIRTELHSTCSRPASEPQSYTDW